MLDSYKVNIFFIKLCIYLICQNNKYYENDHLSLLISNNSFLPKHFRFCYLSFSIPNFPSYTSYIFPLTSIFSLFPRINYALNRSFLSWRTNDATFTFSTVHVWKGVSSLPTPLSLIPPTAGSVGQNIVGVFAPLLYFFLQVCHVYSDVLCRSEWGQ